MSPTRQASAYNPDAPSSPTLDVIATFSADANLREKLRHAFLRMLRFYGFELAGGTISLAHPDRKESGLVPGDQNVLRITRILDSLTTLGLEEEARTSSRRSPDQDTRAKPVSARDEPEPR